MKSPLTIIEASIQALQILNKPSSIEEIRDIIDKNSLYTFGAQEENINSTIRNNIERSSEGTNRTQLNKDKYFERIAPNQYTLLEKEKKLNFYWVNVGISKSIVKEQKFLWAPQYILNSKTQKKSKNAGWEQVKNVRKGDVIFCCYEQKVHYVAIVKSDSYSSPRPKEKEFESWIKNATTDGTRIDIDIQILETPIDVNDIKNDVIETYNRQCTPVLFTQKNTINQQYMIRLADSIGVIVLKLIGDESLSIQNKISANRSLKKRKKPSITQRDAISKARVGQGYFREELIEYWNSTCPISNVNDKKLLIASHILPWTIANDEEKLDKYNGFLFSPSVDKLFDKGYISFDNEGKILIKEEINIQNIKKLGIRINSQINNLEEKHKYYLRIHREIFGFN